MDVITLKVTEKLIRELFAENCSLVALLVEKNIISKDELHARKEKFVEERQKVFEALHDELDNPFMASFFESMEKAEIKEVSEHD